MWAKLEFFDEFLLDNLFECFSRWTQRTFGLTCFFWAKVHTVLTLGLLALFSGLLMADTSPGVIEEGIAESVALIVAAVMALIQIRQLFQIRAIEKLLDRLGSERVLNGWRVDRQKARISNSFKLIGFFVLSGMVGFPSFSWAILGFFLVDNLAEYFMACTPLPPGTSKVREFLNSLRRLRFHVPLPSPSAG